MTITILTPTGSAMIKNTSAKDGGKALVKYLRRLQVEKIPFLVLPQGTSASDLHHVTSSESLEYHG